jgi:hypothetical protein
MSCLDYWRHRSRPGSTVIILCLLCWFPSESAYRYQIIISKKSEVLYLPLTGFRFLRCYVALHRCRRSTVQTHGRPLFPLPLYYFPFTSFARKPSNSRYKTCPPQYMNFLSTKSIEK